MLHAFSPITDSFGKIIMVPQAFGMHYTLHNSGQGLTGVPPMVIHARTSDLAKKMLRLRHVTETVRHWYLWHDIFMGTADLYPTPLHTTDMLPGLAMRDSFRYTPFLELAMRAAKRVRTKH